MTTVNLASVKSSEGYGICHDVMVDQGYHFGISRWDKIRWWIMINIFRKSPWSLAAEGIWVK